MFTRSILFASLCGFSWLATTGQAGAADGRKPNILVILSDDVGWAEYGFQGGKDIPTPNIDSIARNGVRFTQGYVSGPYCSPTRAGLMTGRYQTRFGHENNRVPVVSGLPLTETTIADRLRARGYATCAIGKWHLGVKPEFRPTKRGFDEYLRHPGQHALLPPDPVRRLADLRRRPAGCSTTTSTRPTSMPTAPSTGSARIKDRPWFLYLPFNAQHAPLEAPRKYLDRFPSIHRPDPEALRRLHVGDGRCRGQGPGKGPRDGPGGQHPDRLHLRQRRADPPDVLEQRPAPRLQGDDLGRGRPGAVLHPMEGDQMPAGKTYDNPIIQLDILPDRLGRRRAPTIDPGLEARRRRPQALSRPEKSRGQAARDPLLAVRRPMGRSARGTGSWSSPTTAQRPARTLPTSPKTSARRPIAPSGTPRSSAELRQAIYNLWNAEQAEPIAPMENPNPNAAAKKAAKKKAAAKKAADDL